jgi:uncharacterized protein
MSINTKTTKMIIVFAVICCFAGGLRASAPIDPMQSLTKAAEKNNVNAQYFLGRAYYNGLFAGTHDTEKAVHWLTKAAENGSTKAQSYLGGLYYKGIDGKPDYKKAYKWLSLAVKENDIDAFKHLASMYFNGRGVDKDYKKAFSYSNMSARFSLDGRSQMLLGLMYYKGMGTKQNTEKAIYWLNKAAFVGCDSDAQYLLAVILLGNKDKADYDKAYSLLEDSATQDNEDAQIKLATLYIKGEGRKKDGFAAAYWLRRAMINTKSQEAKEIYDKYNLDKYKFNN